MRWLFVLLIASLAISDIFSIQFSLGPGLSIKNALLYLITFGLFFRFVLGGERSLALPSIHVCFAVWVCYALLSWIIAGYFIEYRDYDVIDAAIKLKASIIDSMLVFMCVFFGVRNAADARFVLKALLVAVAIANLATLSDVAGLSSFGVRVGDTGAEEGRVFGVFGHANETGALIVTLLPAMIAAAMASHRLARLAWIFALVASTLVMILTVSRGAYVAAIVGTAGAAYLCRRYVSATHLAAGGALVLCAIVLVLAFAIVIDPTLGHTLVERVLGQTTAVDVREVSSGRTSIWLDVVRRMMAEPITLVTGYGWDAYSAMPFRYATHNHYLNLWFNLGVVGVAAFVFLLRQVMVTARAAVPAAEDEQDRKQLLAFVFGIVAFSIAAFFTNIYGPWLYLWIYIGAVMRIAVAVSENAPANVSQAIEYPIAPVAVRAPMARRFQQSGS
jgi:O-antigen ligase